MKHVPMVAMLGRTLVFCGLCCITLGVRVSFTGCQQPWACNATEIVYTCSLVVSNDFIVYLKDFYTENAVSVVVQNCRDVRVVLDCSTLQRPSRVQHFKIKDCDRLEFVTLSSTIAQTPPELTIENVREVVSLPRNIFKSASTNTELKCMGTQHFKKLRVVNSKINIINTRAISNVTQLDSMEFQNVTIGDINSQGIEIVTNSNKTVFIVTNSKILNLDFKAVTVQNANTVKLVSNDFRDIRANAINITAETLLIRGNKFKEINANCIITSAFKTDISDNNINKLKTNALSGIKCSKKTGNKEIKFKRNKIEKVEPLSLYFDYGSCKTNTFVEYKDNKIDCKCRSISFLNSNNDLNDIILNTSNNNTCDMDACVLPVEIVKLLLENDMCHLNLDPQVMCLLYNDKHSSSDVTTEGEVTEAPTFYLIRQANTLHGGAAMTAINKDDLLRDNHVNVTNRTTVKVVFDSSRDFVETLRSTSGTRTNKSPSREEYINRCVGSQCKNTVQYDKQKALEFYKYVYAQLRTPRVDIQTKN